MDPDEIFQQHQKTCSLDEVFANGAHRRHAGWAHMPLGRRDCNCCSTASAPADPPTCNAAGKSKQDLSRRTSSGNWIEDRVTWKEEMSYKRAMGYM